MIIPRSTVLASYNVPAVSPIPFAALFSASLLRRFFRLPDISSRYLPVFIPDISLA